MLEDGRILSWSHDFTLRLWDGKTGEALATLEGHTDSVWTAQMLEDGRILSWSHDCTLRLWDGKTGEALATLEGHTWWPRGAQVLEDGRILSWSYDRTLRLWDGKTGEALATLEGHTDSVWGAQMLEDGRILSWSRDASSSRSRDGTLRLWDGRTGEALDVVQKRGAARQAPEIHRVWARADSAFAVQGASAVRGREGGANLTVDSHALRWEGEGHWDADTLLPTGTLTVRCAKDLAFLQLHHGSRRVTIDEAVQFLGEKPQLSKKPDRPLHEGG
jgi:WD40 repeat protein